MMFIFYRHIYGISGNELMPPEIACHKTIVKYNPLSNGRHTPEDFRCAMTMLAWMLRKEFNNTKAEPYSICDGISWTCIDFNLGPI